MSYTLEELRHLAKEILGAAVLELFPSAKLIDGEVDEVSFFYDFHFPRSIVEVFSQKELEHIEDRMRMIVIEDRPIKKLEMMRENAVFFLEHLKQPFRAEKAAEARENIVTLMEIGQFRDLCPGKYLSRTKDLKSFRLMEYQIFSDRSVRISGTAFFDSYELKNYLKLVKQAKNKDYHLLGPKLGYLLFLDEECIFLSKGEELFHTLYTIWRKEHIQSGFHLIAYKEDEEGFEELHKEILERKKLKKIAAFSHLSGDIATVLVENEDELLEAVISSLHFIGKVFKIFGFETRVVCLQANPSVLSRALEKEGIDYEKVVSKKTQTLEFRACDCYGREKVLSLLKIEEEKNMLHRSLFWSIENWIALCIEKGVDRV